MGESDEAAPGQDEDGYGLQPTTEVIVQLFKALDDADEKAEPVKDLKRAIKDAAKKAGVAVDCLTTVHKLRGLEPLKAQAWLINLNHYAKLAGIWDQGDGFGGPPPDFPDELQPEHRGDNVERFPRPARGGRRRAEN